MENWISSFCSLLGHEFFAEVSEDFIEDDFNLTGLSSQVPLYKEALEMILDVEPEDEDSEHDFDDASDPSLEFDEAERPTERFAARQRNRLPDPNQIEQSAELLYGLIHQRFITSRPGISQMHEKYSAGHFGQCPRVYCNSARVLPVGLSDTPNTETVKLFCPSCLDVYTPPNSRFQNVDGASFGTTFGCLFLMTYPEIQIAGPVVGIGAAQAQARGGDGMSGRRSSAQPSAQPLDVNGVAPNNFAPGLGAFNVYEPRIYGFRISERAKTGPRMQWLRMKPDDLTVLDEASRFEAIKEMEDAEAAEGDDSEGADQGEAMETEVQQQQGKKTASRRRKDDDEAEELEEDGEEVPDAAEG